MTGRRIGRFIVRAELGRGGMGVVYRAEDPTLGRPVALKLLPPEVSGSFHAREQLLAEARAAAVLDHPNICTVYDAGESSTGEIYLAMPLYEGQTLSQRLDQAAGARLTLTDATDIAIQIAQGLAAAHAIGIVHRDIKPSNVMITRGGLVKILDFGIARAMTDPEVTGPPIVGTPRYMAPEQLNGVADLDGAVDAWALGVLFYEMVAGAPPFTGPTTQALLKSILFDEPAPVASDLAEFARIKSIIYGLLEKDRARRLTIDEFLTRVARPSAALSGAPRDKSLAVLPFHHIGAESDGGYFTDGLTAEIIADLSRVRGLRVTSWTSVRRYRDATMNARELARELDVHYVLEGTVRLAGRDLRVTAQLVDATSDGEIWSGKYSGTLDDVFEIQERVSEAITEGLRLTLTRGVPASARSIADARAYDLYLRARGEIWSFTAEGPRRAIERIDHALQIVGPNALLLATRAAALWQLVNTGASDLSQLHDAAQTARQALDLNPLSAPALRVLALISAMRGQSQAADELLGRALMAAPADPETLSSASFFYTLFGDSERAAALGRRATEIDPLYALHWTALGFALASLGRDDEAAAAARRAFDIDPRDLPTQVIAPLILYGRGDLAAALERAILPAAPRPGAPAGGYAGLAHLTRAALAGDRARVDAIVTPEVAQFLAGGVHNALFAAEIFCLVDNPARGLTFLEQSAALGLACYPLVATHSRSLAPLRNEPGFRDVLATIESAWRGRVAFSKVGPTGNQTS